MLLMMACAATLMGQSVQHGQVVCYNGTQPKTPLGHVAVAASNAPSVMSDDEGAFTLSFRTLHPGDAIQFRRIELAGYEVMNREALDAARIARNPETRVTVVLASKESLRQLRDGYRSVATRRYEQQLRATTQQLEQLRRSGQLAEAEYNARMDSLESAYDDKLSKLENYIDKFARIDLSDLDRDEQQILALVQKGEFDEALRIYESQNLTERLQQSRADQSRLASARDQIAEAAQLRQSENDRLRASIDRQITLLLMAGGDDNVRKVHQLRRATYLADTTHVGARLEYSLALLQQGDNEGAITLLRNAESAEKDLYTRGLLLINLLTYCWNNGQHEEAVRLAQLADSLLTPIQDCYDGVSTRCLPVWSCYEMLYFIQTNQLEKCQPIVERARRQWSPDTLRVESLTSYHALLSVVNEYYSIVNDVPQSLWAAAESMRLGRQLEAKAQWMHLYGIACANACQTYMFQDMREEAIDAACQSIADLRQQLQKAGGRRSYLVVFETAFTLTEALVPWGEFALADSVVELIDSHQAAEQLKPRAEDGSLEYLGLYRLYVAQVLLHHGRADEAETLLHATVGMLDGTEVGPDVMQMLLPEIQARIHLARCQYEPALTACQEAIAANAAAYEESPDAWSADNLCRTYLLLCDVQRAAGQNAEAKKVLKQAERVAVFPSNKAAVKQAKKNKYTIN